MIPISGQNISFSYLSTEMAGKDTVVALKATSVIELT